MAANILSLAWLTLYHTHIVLQHIINLYPEDKVKLAKPWPVCYWCVHFLTVINAMPAFSFTLLSHWGRATHICVGKLTIIGSDNGLSPGRCQAIIWTNAGILLIQPLGTNLSEILIGIQTFLFKKCTWKCRLPNGVHLSWPQCVNDRTDRNINEWVYYKTGSWTIIKDMLLARAIKLSPKSYMLLSQLTLCGEFKRETLDTMAISVNVKCGNIFFCN